MILTWFIFDSETGNRRRKAMRAMGI